MPQLYLVNNTHGKINEFQKFGFYDSKKSPDQLVYTDGKNLIHTLNLNYKPINFSGMIKSFLKNHGLFEENKFYNSKILNAVTSSRSRHGKL